MSKPSRLARPFFANAASKLPSSRRDDLNSKQKKSSLGEKILKTGSEGNLVKQQQVQTAATPAQRKTSPHKGNVLNQLFFLSFGLETSFLIILPRNWDETGFKNLAICVSLAFLQFSGVLLK